MPLDGPPISMSKKSTVIASRGMKLGWITTPA